MEKIKFHNGNYAISVEFPKCPASYIDYVSEEIMNWLDDLEIKLSKKYPSFEIILIWSGQYGEWCELRGNWRLESEHGRGYKLIESSNRQRIIEKYILPAFEHGVNNIITKHNNLLTEIINKYFLLYEKGVKS